jgi:hypothetical protein
MRAWAAVALALVCGGLAACGAGRGAAPAPAAAGPGGCLRALRPAAPGGTADCPSPRPASPDALDRVLARAGLTRCDLTLPRARVEAIVGVARARDPFRLPFFDALLEAPLRLPAFARETVAWLDEALAGDAPVSGALQVAALRLGHDLGEICPYPAPPEVAEARAPLAAAVAAVIAAAGGTPDLPALARAAGGVPRPLQAALAPILAATVEVARARAAALARVPPALWPHLADGGADLFSMAAPRLAPELAAELARAAAGETFDFAPLYQAAARLARTIERAGLERFAGIHTAPFTQPTPWGRVVIGGPGPDVYDPRRRPDLAGDLLLLVDTGGDDVYLIPAGATGSLDNPVSLLFDLAGRDIYGYVEAPDPQDAVAERLPSDAAGRDAKGATRSSVARQGAGRLGVGFLFDFGRGRDVYRSLRLSQGFGRFGVGALLDDGGDDTYVAEALAQGAGLFGIGLLVDRAGRDRYTSYTLSQGVGWVRGVGVLLDGGGDDRYEVNPGDPARGGDPLYPSPQAPGRSNTSLAQGAGFGLRTALGPAPAASGGLGVLRDRGGDDVYRASVFAQGTGYWFGTGILADDRGADTYDGLWYVQGAAAHMALAYFADEAGDDRYNQTLEPLATSLGVGHDLAAAIHWDGGGRDVYRGAGLTFGAGSAQGLGLFINLGGDDVYDGPAGLGFGAAHAEVPPGARRAAPTYGFFVHAGGRARYLSPDRPPGVTAGEVWTGRVEPAGDPGPARGAGGDAREGTVRLP